MSPGASDRDPSDEPDDVDARFAELVASLDEVEDLPPSENPERDEPEGPARGPGLTYPVAPWVAAGPRDWDATGQLAEAEDDVDALDAFVPPDPGPVTGSDPLVTMAWLAAAGIPALSFVLFLVWRSAPPVIFQAGGIVCLAGIVLLLWRMPARRDPDDHDSGAVV